MESFAHLRAALRSTLGARGSHRGEQELFDELNESRSHLVNLFHVGSKNPQEQRELESGRTVVNGRPLAVNPDFARQVVFISYQLECSERYVAGLLHKIMIENTNLSTVESTEATVLEFHRRRRELSDCLRYILEAAEGAEAHDAPQIYVAIDGFVRQYLIPPADPSKPELSLAFKIFREMDSLGNELWKAQNAKQNAGSDTVLAGNQGRPPALGHDVLAARCDSLKYERRTLAISLFLIARLGYLSPFEIQKLVEWLSSNPRHALTYYILTTTLVAFDSVDPGSISGQTKERLSTDPNLMSFMKRQLSLKTEWKDVGLKSTVLLKWTLFLTEARHRNPTLEQHEGFRTEELETQIWNAVQGDAFNYLVLAVVHIQKSSSYPASSFASPLIFSSQRDQQWEAPAEDFKPAVLQAFENLLRGLITHALSEIRKIKQRQEDLILASARSDRSRTSRPSGTVRFTPTNGSEQETCSHPSPRNDIGMLFSFIGILYSALPPDSALQFWGSNHGESQRTTYIMHMETKAPKLPSFLQWAVWSTQARDLDVSMALYDMLAGLAKGQQCSELAYNFMARGGAEVIPGSTLPSSTGHVYSSGPTVSWNTVFGLMESWANAAANPRAPPPPNPPSLSSQQPWRQPPAPAHQHPQQLVLSPKDVLLAQSYLRLLKTVVTYSVAVRVAICGHVQFRAIPTLMSLVPLGIPLELKGSIFGTIAAFCEPGAGVPGVDICKAVWALMERLEVINVRSGTGSLAGAAAVKGVEVELEEVESVHKMYPSTIPFLELLSTLIHTPKRVPLKNRVPDVESINTIPESLGSAFRSRGIGPYVSFVADNVFSRISSREYLRPTDRWQTNDLCLCFIERCLASYDLEVLMDGRNEEVRVGPELITPLVVHPGYDIMKRLLTNSPLQASILSYIVDCLEGLDRGFADEEPYFRSTVVRVLRIVHRVLEIQDVFVDVLIPLLSEFDNLTMDGVVPPRSYFTRFDQALSFGPQYVPSLAVYVVHPAYPEIALLSIKILSALSRSNAIANLGALIERSGDSERILQGYRLIMERDSMQDISSAETIADECTGAGAPDSEELSDSLVQAIRLAAVDLFIENTRSGQHYPNIGHFLLLGSTTTDHRIEDPHALNARTTCIHVIFDALMAGIPKLKEMGKDRGRRRTSQIDPMFLSLPGMAERFYHIVHQLCVHPQTSDFTMRYLRTREDFFARQLAAITFKAPTIADEPFVEVIYNDGARSITTVPVLSQFLRLRSWIFDLVALELHVLTNKGHRKGVADLLEIIFGNEEAYYQGEDTDGWDPVAYRPFHEVGQSHLRIIEFLQSLNFDWSDSLVIHPVELQLLGQLNLLSCVRVDDSGCEIVDKSALLYLLASARRALHAQGRVATPGHLEQLSAEIAYILESCAVENHRREVRYAVSAGYESWRRLLDVTLMKCFDQLSHDRRENMLLDLLHALPIAIRSVNVQERTAVLLSEAILSCITKLREDRRHQTIIQSAGGDVEAGALPAERLSALLRSILEIVTDNNCMEFVRGNLYAALVNYQHLIASADVGSDSDMRSLSMSLSSSSIRESVFGASQMSLVAPNQVKRSAYTASTLQSVSLAVLKGAAERLVGVVARDAIDGSEVWKTVAFMLLDSLVQIFRLEPQNTIVSALVRHGLLSNFVRGLKESDNVLQSVLKPDPDDLNPLYVYESKMSMLVRIAQTRQGAERLLETQLFRALSQCDYLDARPELDQAFIDHDSFLPSAVERYHQLFMPALQVVDAMLATLGSKHATATNQALEFLSSHRDTIIILLKNESSSISLSIVEEIHLLVSLCVCVLPLVPESELLSPNHGFGGVHAAILHLASKGLSADRWLDNVQPHTEAEMRDAAVYPPGHGSNTKFTISLRQKERMLRKSLVAYLGTASAFTEPEFKLVVSPITTTSFNEDRPSGYHAAAPSIGDTIEALSEVCGDLTDTLNQIADLSAELANRDHIRVEHIQEILDLSDADFLDELDMSQRRTLVCRMIERTLNDVQETGNVLLTTLEMLMLLLWRHLLYYSENREAGSLQTRASLSHSMRHTALPDAQTFKGEVGNKLAPVLQRLASLDLTFETPKGDWRSNKAYVDIMIRRLKETSEMHHSELEGL